MKTLSYFTDEEIVPLIRDEKYDSIRAILKKLGVSNIRSGSYYFRIRNLASANEIDVSHWSGGHFSKGKSIGDRGRRWKVFPLSDYLSNKRKINSSKLKQRLIEEGLKSEQCEVCGVTKWNDLFLMLQLHHKDGHRNNNVIENLQILCPNCHSQTRNFSRGYGHKKM